MSDAIFTQVRLMLCVCRRYIRGKWRIISILRMTFSRLFSASCACCSVFSYHVIIMQFPLHFCILHLALKIVYSLGFEFLRSDRAGHHSHVSLSRTPPVIGIEWSLHTQNSHFSYFGRTVGYLAKHKYQKNDKLIVQCCQN